jgi:hypothetical protein
MCSGEDVIVATFNGQRRNVGRCQTYVGAQLSPLSVERYTSVPHPAVLAKIVPTGLIARDQMLLQSKPLFTGVQLSPLSVDRKTTPPKICPCKNVATRIGYQRANIGSDHVVINFYPTRLHNQ